MTRTKKIVLIISAVVVVAAVAAVVLFFTTNLFDAFKSPKTLFYQYVDKMSEAMPESTYESFLNELKESKGKSYKSSANIAVEMESHSYQYKETAEILNGLGMSVNQQVNPEQLESSSEVAININNTEFTKAKAVVNEDVIAVTIDELLDNYFVLKNENLKALADKYGIDSTVIPDKIEMQDTSNLMYDLYYVDEGYIKEFKEKYKKVIEDQFDKSKYSKSTKSIKVDGDSVKTDVYTLKLSAKDIASLAEELLETAKNDDELLDLIVNKFNIISEYSGQEISLSKAELKAGIELLIGELKDADTSADVDIKINIYAYKGNTVRAEIEISASGEKVVIGADIKTKNNVTTYTIDLKAAGQTMEIATIEITVKDKKIVKEKVTMDVPSVMTMEMVLETPNFNETKMSLMIDLPSQFKVTLNLDAKTEYTSVNIEEINIEDSYVVNDLSEEDLTNIGLEVIQNLAPYIENREDTILELMQSIGGMTATNARTTLKNLVDQIKQVQNLQSLTSTQYTTAPDNL